MCNVLPRSGYGRIDGGNGGDCGERGKEKRKKMGHHPAVGEKAYFLCADTWAELKCGDYGVRRVGYVVVVVLCERETQFVTVLFFF